MSGDLSAGARPIVAEATALSVFHWTGVLNVTRRRLVAYVSAGILLGGGAVALGTVAMLTRTQWGRDHVRTYVENLLNEKIQGKVHIGRVSGSLFTDIVVDSFSLYDLEDSLFIATGRVSVRFDPRDLIDRRILVSQVVVEHPNVRIAEDSTGTWNYRKVFPPGPPGPKRTTRGYGDYIIVRDAELRDLSFDLIQRWRPPDSLRGVRRDSAITYALNRKDKIVRPSGSNYVQTRTWRNGFLRVPFARIADPDTADRFFVIDELDADEFDPPFNFRNGRATVRLLSDSTWLDVSHIELPGSVARGGGKVVRGNGRPTRYDITIRSDSMAMADIAWIYPTLPKTGSGSMTLAIRSQPDPRIIDYVISDMDVRSMQSRLRGGMTFSVGAEVLAVSDVNVTMAPMDWVLIEQLTGPLPYPWKGTLEGTVRASGGPVNRFMIDEAAFVFRDANVPGKGATALVKGELDILFPATTVFRGFDVDLARLDLESIQFLNPAFARLDGYITGHTRLDSVWTDVRFRNADLTHHFADAATSRITGNGRVTITDSTLIYDVALVADQLNLTSVARAWPELELVQRGAFTGPVRLQGTFADLELSTTLQGASGTYAYDGRVDLDSIGGYGYRGTLQFRNANLRALYDTVAMPVTALNGEADLTLTGDSVANWVGGVDVRLTRSSVDSALIYSGAVARLRFDDGIVRVDSLYGESPIGVVRAAGAIGLRADRSDSLHVDFVADSIGGARVWLPSAAVDSLGAISDSLTGRIEARIGLTGSTVALRATGTVEARGVEALSVRAREAVARIDLSDVTSDSIAGTVRLTADSMQFGTIRSELLNVEAMVRSKEVTDVQGRMALRDGPEIESTINLRVRNDTVTSVVSALQIAFSDHDWRLEKPTTIVVAPDAWSVDSLALAGSRGGNLGLDAAVQSGSPSRLALSGDSVSLRDLGILAQAPFELGGALSFDLSARGERDAPEVTLSGRIDGTSVADVSLQRTVLSGQGRNQRFNGQLSIVRNDTTVLSLIANVPLDLALASRETRVLDDSLRLALLSRDVDLALVETLTPTVKDAGGRFNANISLSGPRNDATLSGFMRVEQGRGALPDLGIDLRGFEAFVEASEDTVYVRRFKTVSGETTRDSLWLSGWIASQDWASGLAPSGREADVGFDLRLATNNFRAINSRRTGRMDVSSNVRLTGTTSGSELSGDVTVNSASVVIPELNSKRVVSLADDQLFNLVDTTLVANRRILPRTPSALARNLNVRNLRVTMGPDVWLQSVEANIKLGGSVNVINGRGLAAGGVPQLALEGALRTEQGTFNFRLADIFVERIFRIEGGQVQFLGDADFNPDLDVRALYTVRQSSSLYGSGNDIRIRARLAGTLVQPRLVLESADSLQLSESDLISYLFFGRPSAEIGGVQNTAPDLFLSTAASFLSARLSGGFFDVIELQASALRASGGGGANSAVGNGGTQGSTFERLFAGSQLGVGKQLGENTFISLTAGLCPIGRLFSQTAPASQITELFGFSLEQKLGAGYGLSLSSEPRLGALLCDQSGSASVGFLPTVRQWGFDLFKAWRW